MGQYLVQLIMLRNILGPDIDLCLDQILTFLILDNFGSILLFEFLPKTLFYSVFSTHLHFFKPTPQKLGTRFVNTTVLTDKKSAFLVWGFLPCQFYPRMHKAS